MLIHSPAQLALMLRDSREQQKLSQDRASQLVGLKQATLSKFENSPDGTKLDTFFRILSALSMELHVLPKKAGTSFSNPVESWTKEW